MEIFPLPAFLSNCLDLRECPDENDEEKDGDDDADDDLHLHVLPELLPLNPDGRSEK